MTAQIDHFLDGARVTGASGRFGDVFNPATGDIAARVSLASQAETEAAIAAAAAALPKWATTPPIQRARVMFKYKELIEKNIDELARLLVSEDLAVFAD